MNRRDSARIAAMRAAEAAEMAGLPAPEGLGLRVGSLLPLRRRPDPGRWRPGATAVIQPGGSIRDAEVIAAADERGIAMAFTGVRVFRH